MRKFLVPLPILAFILVACTTLTNITPTTHVRNSSGLYPVEFIWDSRQQTVRPDSIQPSVLIGTDSYPMQATLQITNRWETLIPVPATEKFVRYRIKVDYLYNSFPEPKKNSRLTEEYRLEIVEPK